VEQYDLTVEVIRQKFRVAVHNNSRSFDNGLATSLSLLLHDILCLPWPRRCLPRSSSLSARALYQTRKPHAEICHTRCFPSSSFQQMEISRLFHLGQEVLRYCHERAADNNHLRRLDIGRDFCYDTCARFVCGTCQERPQASEKLMTCRT
jgi:hypothetical protein